MSNVLIHINILGAKRELLKLNKDEFIFVEFSEFSGDMRLIFLV